MPQAALPTPFLRVLANPANHRSSATMESSTLWSPSRISSPAPASAAPDSIARTAYATLAAVLAAEAADLDVLWGFAGPVEELKHHRGITHTFIAVPFVAAAVVGASSGSAIGGVKRRARASSGTRCRSKHEAPPRPQPQPVRWLWVYLAALIAALSHLLLDWTNNYGVRPFFPFNPRWYAGSFVFIAEPVLWVLFAARAHRSRLPGPGRSRDRRAAHSISRTRLGHLRALRNGSAVVPALCRTCPGHGLIENIPVTTAPSRALHLSPTRSIPSAGTRFSKRKTIYQSAEVNTRTEMSTATRRPTCCLQAAGHTRRRSRQAHRSRPGLSGLGHAGPWCATLARSTIPASIRRACRPAAPGPPLSSPICVSATIFEETGTPVRPQAWAEPSTSSTTMKTRARRWAAKNRNSGVAF